jgi:hypothetical protein
MRPNGERQSLDFARSAGQQNELVERMSRRSISDPLAHARSYEERKPQLIHSLTLAATKSGSLN